MAGVIVPFFLTWGGISLSEMMMLQAWFVFSIFLFEVPTGTIADYFGRKHSMIAAGFVGMLGCLMYLIKPDFWLFAIGETLWAIGATLVSGADEALIYDSLKKMKKEKTSKKVLGRFQSWGLAGMLVAAPVGSIAAGMYGLPFPFLMTACSFLASGLLAFTLIEPRFKKKKHEESMRYWNILKTGLRYFKNHKELKILAFDTISIGALAALIFWVFQIRLTELEFPVAYFGFVHMAWLVVEILVVTNFGLLEMLAGSKRNYLFLSALIPGVGFILTAYVDYVPLLILILILVGSFAYTRPFLFNHYMHKYIPSRQRATVMSTISMLRNFVRGGIYLVMAVTMKASLAASLVVIGVAILVCATVSKVEEDMLLD